MELYNKEFFQSLLGVHSNLYFAHLPRPEQDTRKPELLSEHSSLTVAYAQSLADANNLNCIIEHLVNDSIPSILPHKQLLAETISKWFWRAIAFHDLGKINHLFQRNRMNNEALILKVEHNFKSEHSVISAYLYLALFFSDLVLLELTEEEQVFLSNILLYMSCTIRYHHSDSLYDCQNEDAWCERENRKLVVREDIKSLSPYINVLNCQYDSDKVNQFHEFFLGNANFNMLFACFNSITEQSCGFPLYALVKLLYSLLTTSDYLATAHYMNDWEDMLQDYGLITDELRNKIVSNAHTTQGYNKQTFLDIASGVLIDPNDYTEQNGQNLNKLREALAIETVRNVRENVNKRLFYIEAPTGGGKTNASMLALSELLDNDKTIQKVFYVFPFTTLITQTSKNIKETFGLYENEVIEFHSKSIKETNRYEDDYLNYLDCLFLNVPLVLISHVSFFDVLKTNKKSNNYLHQRIAHSVVVIDEIQSYSPAIWDKMVYLISNYAEYFDMRFILMSATLPKIGELIDSKLIKNSFVYLIKNKDDYFKNPNFCKRVEFDYSLLDKKRPEKENADDYLTNLCDFVSEKSKEYADNNDDHPQSVLTIVEFIFKKSAGKFIEIVQNSETCFDVVLLLSGTIIEPRRKQIINYLKSKEIRTKKVLLITTQVVEAGVDIDMDLGFKDVSLIDSEEQIAGRINRNANKKTCKLYLFDFNTEKTLYGNDDRYKFMEELDSEDYQYILNNKDFDFLYKKVIEHIKQRNLSEFIINMQDFQQAVSHLHYKEVSDSFKIIDQNTINVFVPLSINAELIDSSLIQCLDEFGLMHSETVYGKDVWEKYKEIVISKDDYIQNKIKLKKISAIMSLFTFSVFPNSKEESVLKTYGIKDFGYLYLESYSDIYSLENGINANTLHLSNYL